MAAVTDVKSIDIQQDDVSQTTSSTRNAKGHLLMKTLSYEKAMSMPHGSSPQVTGDDTNDAWFRDARKDVLSEKVDWTVSALNRCHIWTDTDLSGCYNLEDCKKTGPRKKCTACKIVVHQKCIEQIERFHSCKCKATFVEAFPSGHIEDTQHHIIQRRKQDGKCDSCGKAFQSVLSFQSAKDMVAFSCSWCKRAVHNKPECIKQFFLESSCTLGELQRVIVPPAWILKLPPRKYSQGATLKKNRRPTRRRSSRERRAFVIKAAASEDKIPLVVFVNPKSGGNQGLRILQRFHWLLNPRQVFDIMDGGPRFASKMPGNYCAKSLELYRKVPNARILVCGGDGTVGWVLSEIDRLRITPAPPVAILPLGTGNDLARFLGWGSGYFDEPLSKIICNIEDGEVEKLDRWDLDVRPNQDVKDMDSDDGRTKLPLNVMNNYFSLGADADVCLEFHESREANPDKFNSRLKNLMFYGRVGGRQVFQSRHKDLYKCIDSFLIRVFRRIEIIVKHANQPRLNFQKCDGHDLTEAIRDLRPLSLLFLNISKYSAGTSPWGHPNSEEFLPQTCDDGYIEIIGFRSASMVANQVGGHGVRIFQGTQAILVTNRSLSMQVDGEPCRLKPSRIHIKRRCQANMVFKKKHHHSFYSRMNSSEDGSDKDKIVTSKIFYLTFPEYEKLTRYDIEELSSKAKEVMTVQVDPERQLDEMRVALEELRLKEMKLKCMLSEKWCFLDATWTNRIYRIDEAQESFMYVGDVLEGGIFVLDLGVHDPDQATLLASSPVVSGTRSQPNTPPRLTRRVSSPDTNEFTSNSIQNSMDKLSLDLDEEGQDETSSSEDSENSHSSSDEAEMSSSREGSPCVPLSPSSPPNSKMEIPDPEEFKAPNDMQLKKKMLLESGRRGLLSQFKALHEAEASLLWCDSRGCTPLHVAAKYGQKDIVTYIIQNVPGCVLDLVDDEKGQTALHKAAHYRRRTICRLLVSSGASLTRQDLEGNTPRLLALKARDTELAKFLENQERLQIIASDDHETAV